MSTATLSAARPGVLREPWDALLVALALGHGLLLWAVPSAVVVALGLWWGSNTVAHYFLHRPFFHARPLNAVFGLYLSVLLGVPQVLWRDRHLAHHAGVAPRLRWSRRLVVEAAAVLLLWGWLLAFHPAFFVTTYVPGYAAGLALCALHGHYEHARGTVSHRGLLYNLLFFNDGYHAEHHACPGEHWTRLPRRPAPEAPTSRWPAVLRWLEALSLDGLERWVLRSPRLQRFVVGRHERAFRALLPELAGVRRVCVVGGGLFPRTLLVLRRILPGAEITLLDCDAGNLETASRFLGGGPPTPALPHGGGREKNLLPPPPSVGEGWGGGLRYIHAWYDPALVAGFDLVVFPLAFRGDREAVYRHPPSPLVVVHDWLWRRRGTGVVVSPLLCKRLNLVRA